MSQAQGVPGEAGQGAVISPPVSPPVAPPAEPAAPAVEEKPWYASLADARLRGYAEVKGWKGIDQVITSYENLEKLRGVPAERLLTLPENLDDAAAVAPILAKLGYGAPEKAEEYGFATAEGVADVARAHALEALALKHGIPTKMAQAFFADFAAAERQAMVEFEQQMSEETAAEHGAFAAQYGEKADAMKENARRFVRNLGVDDEMLKDLEARVGPKKFFEIFAAAGDKLGESKFIDGQGGNKNFAMTADGAKSMRDQLLSDKDFVAKYTGGDKAAAERMARLNQIIAGGGQ